MKTLETIVIVFALVLFVAGAAEAVDLFTPPLFVDAADVMVCQIANVTTTDRNVRIQLIGTSGNVLRTDNFTLGAGDINYTATPGATITPNIAYCRFTVPSKAYFRAGASITTGAGLTYVFAPAQ